MRTVAVAGLGLIGGSLARDLASAGSRILGWDGDAATVRAAVGEGIVSAALGPELEGVEDADVLVIAVPVGAAAGVLERAMPRLASVRLVTDTGSTKASIVAAAERLGIGDRFVGSHPFAGSHRGGWTASREKLFERAVVYLSPTSRTSEDAMALARELWSGVGGLPREISADEHDARLAWTSHLPQAVSGALGAAIADAGFTRADLGTGGRDVTRLAASSSSLWADIFLDNRVPVAEALAAVEARLRALRAAIESGDADAITRAAFPPSTWSGEAGSSH